MIAADCASCFASFDPLCCLVAVQRTSKEDTPSAKKRKADAGKGGDEEDAKQQ